MGSYVWGKIFPLFHNENNLILCFQRKIFPKVSCILKDVLPHSLNTSPGVTTQHLQAHLGLCFSAFVILWGSCPRSA